MNKKLTLLSVCFLFTSVLSYASNNRTSIPGFWLGDTEKFTSDTQGRLLLSAEREAGTATLYHPSGKTFNTCWEFFVQMEFKPSTNNNVRVYLCGDTSDSGKLWGLCLRIGADKTISLWNEPESGANRSLIKGIQNRLDVERVALSIKATLDSKGVFRLYSRLNEESNYTEEGHTTLTSIAADNYFGLFCTYSITRHKEAFLFSDFNITDFADSSEPEPEPEGIQPLALVINEILYRPYQDGDEYVELYNRSGQAIDLSLVSIATRKADGSLQRIKPLADSETWLQDGRYAVVTGSRENVCSFYSCCSDALFLDLGTMTTLADAGSTVVLFNHRTNTVIDEVTYDDKMHTPGVSTKKGVALERINPDRPGNDRANWTSGAAFANYGSPGCPNASSSAIDSPDGRTGVHIVDPYQMPGQEEYLIKYFFEEEGTRGNLFIYTMEGRVVTQLANNLLLGQEGVFSWNPSSNLSPGLYIVYMEVYSMNGMVRQYKLPVVVRRKR